MMLVKLTAALGLAATAAHAVPHAKSADSNRTFGAWAARHGKIYESEAERLHRLEVWLENAADIHAHRNEGHSWTLELNEYADLSQEEFSARNGLLPMADHPLGANTTLPLLGAADLPDSVDWRDHNLVNPVQNQGSCGSCWAFSTIVSIEGAHAKAKGDLVKLSEQNLVDCVKGQKDPANGQTCCMGCRGGLMNDAMQYIIDKQDGGVDTELSYKYKGVGESTCHFTEDAVGATISSFTQVTSGDEQALMQAVATVGPVSIGVDASTGWQLYRGGVLHPKSSVKGFHPFKKKGGCSSSPTKMDHGVAVVGYGTDDTGGDYWVSARSFLAAAISQCRAAHTKLRSDPVRPCVLRYFVSDRAQQLGPGLGRERLHPPRSRRQRLRYRQRCRLPDRQLSRQPTNCSQIEQQQEEDDVNLG